MKKVVLFIVVFTLLTSFLCCCEIKDRNDSYYDTRYYKVEVSFGCAEIKPDGSPEWEVYPIDCHVDTAYDDTMLKLLNNLKLTPTNDNLTDVELIEISQCNKTEFENDIYIAYDYDLKNEYLYKDGVWYEVNITNKLNKLLIQTLNDSTKYNYCPDITWKVQTRYFAEVFDDTDLDKLIFRYNVHWRPSEKFEERDINFRSTGFKNTYPIVIDNSEQAIQLAAKEMGYENPIGVVFYDKTCGYWMVELYDQKSYDNVPLEFDDIYDYTNAANAYISFLGDNCYTVIIDDNGRTVEVYQHLTTERPFVDIVFANKVIHNR